LSRFGSYITESIREIGQSKFRALRNRSLLFFSRARTTLPSPRPQNYGVS
jgi:hypothetical protein